MRSDNLSQIPVRAMPRFLWVRLARIARLGLGGVTIGSFAGVYLGALCGSLYAAWVGDLSSALDGALLGGVTAALLGGAYGAVLGVTERHGTTGPTATGAPPADLTAAALPPSLGQPVSANLASPPCPPAGRGKPLPTPDMEHSHAR